LNTFGPEADRLSKRSGLWEVVETVGGEPVTTSGLVAERAMLGSMLHVRGVQTGGFGQFVAGRPC
jgi:hypothetical protein